ncbi:MULTISPECIES: GNAT family N-acetyltransferase [unclassified Leucobacter]|uniref:GNAT family N-acetyltransferase n=1 Tax=unclassified Leucobacter TaxID=2621730 RepID=UPI001F13FD1E|nr:GNAT family N-acetyltransferase [Leucobacter sp. CX169]
MTVSFEKAGVAEMDAVSLYAILQLRVDVFVVEQQAAYAELDGRDVEPTARLYWAEEDGAVLATIRVLTEEDGARIGRVATASTARGRGLAAELMRRAILDYGGEMIVLDAQQHLEAWYQGFGFVRSGEVFVEDGIPHIPMTRAAGKTAL